jgi:phospholipid-binding lipoprotein MlaA
MRPGRAQNWFELDFRNSGFAIPLPLLFFLTLLALSCEMSGAAQPASHDQELDPDCVPFFDAVPDPLEGLNRSIWIANEWLFRGIIYPVSFGYNFVAPKPVRNSLAKAGHNLSYPARLVNSCLQGKWNGAWEETKRFGVNSTIGLAGLFDPATRLKIGRSNQDFGLTLGHYGSGPWFYLMIPVAGPSNGRDALGKILDWPLDICFWIGRAYPDELWPQAIRPGLAFNDLSDNARAYKRELDSLVDPYQALRTLYSLNRQRLVTEYVPNRGDFNPDPSVGAVLFRPLTPNFADRADTRKVLVSGTGKELPYSCWMQEKPAPLVCYIPGLGSYRLDRSSLAYADMLYRHGYSVITISNPFQKEFMENASTVAVPGFGPADCDDLVSVLKVVASDIKSVAGDKITSTSLTGVSHGGYFTLLIAAREAAGELGDLTFDRYVAVNPPVKLASALRRLDDMFNAPLAWPRQERRARMREALYKALYFANNGLDISGNIPLSFEESQFLIGVVFRYTLMSAIVDSQQRRNLGVLRHDPNGFVRQDLYREIRQYSFEDYMNLFVLPYIAQAGLGKDAAALKNQTDLERETSRFKGNDKIRVQICEDDFLLSKNQNQWFHATFGKNLTSYTVGGHLGNLHVPAVQEKLVSLFPPAGLTPPTQGAALGPPAAPSNADSTAGAIPYLPKLAASR